jgi:hypothetical protein
MEINNQLENEVEELLDDEEKLLDYVRDAGTEALNLDPIKWYFNELVKTVRSYVAEATEREEAEKRLNKFIRALTFKMPNDFLCLDAVTQMKAETIDGTVRDHCDMACHGRGAYSKCEKRKQKTFAELEKDELCSGLIKKLRRKKHEDKERILSDDEIKDFLKNCKNAAEYIHKVMLHTCSLQTKEYYKIRRFGLKNQTEEQLKEKLNFYMIADLNRCMNRTYRKI